jgi:hypothetical protein
MKRRMKRRVWDRGMKRRRKDLKDIYSIFKEEEEI